MGTAHVERYQVSKGHREEERKEMRERVNVWEISPSFYWENTKKEKGYHEPGCRDR